MNFPVFLSKWIISNRYLRYTPVWFWYRLINHEDYRLDDRFLYQDFWNSICEGQTQMVEDDKWMTYFGAKPETIYLSQRDYDTLVEKINNPDPEQIESLRKLLQRPSPWEVEE
jgi:hypothetical protein